MAEGRHRLTDFDHEYRLLEDEIPLKLKIKQEARRRWKKVDCKEILKRNFSFIESFRGYSLTKDLPNDIVAGITVGIMEIPQGMAYAALSTLPPITGLYSALFGPVVYFFLGNSRFGSLGAIAVTSMMLGSVLDVRLGNSENGLQNSSAIYDLDLNSTINGTMNMSMGEYDIGHSAADSAITPHDMRRIEVATALTFISGLIMMGLGKLGMGFVTCLMPDPLVNGFTTGVAVQVVTSQLKYILGIKIPRHGGVFRVIKTLASVFKHIVEINWATFIISTVAMVIIYIVKICINLRFQRKLKIPIPIELLVIILVTGLSYGIHFKTDYGVSILGPIPAGIPPPSMPDVSLVTDHIGDAVIIGVIAFAQSVSMAKTLALKHGQSVDSNQEMFAYGACGVANSFFMGFIPAFSLARSLVQEGTGGTTQLASLIMCAVVLVVVLSVGPLFYHLPKCILSAVILVNLRGMFRQALQLPPLWRHAKYDLAIWLVTFGATVILDAVLGLAVGIFFSLLTLVIRTQRSLIANLAEVADSGEFRPKNKYKEARITETVLIVDITSPIYFANSEVFSEKLYNAVNQKFGPPSKNKEIMEKKPNANGENPATEQTLLRREGQMEDGRLQEEDRPRRLVLNMTGVSFLDAMGIGVLKRVMNDLIARDIQLTLVGLRDSVADTLRAAEFPDELMDMMYLSMTPLPRDSEEEVDINHVDTSRL